MKAYKIMRMKNGKLHTLFHGLNGSKAVPMGERLTATVKTVRDGSGDRWYRAGWHTLPTLQDAKDYLKRFKKDVESLCIVECTIEDTWDKTHSPKPVVLSRYMTINKIV